VDEDGVGHGNTVGASRRGKCEQRWQAAAAASSAHEPSMAGGVGASDRARASVRERAGSGEASEGALVLPSFHRQEQAVAAEEVGRVSSHGEGALLHGRHTGNSSNTWSSAEWSR
jgi:hypothetical protein